MKILSRLFFIITLFAALFCTRSVIPVTANSSAGVFSQFGALLINTMHPLPLIVDAILLVLIASVFWQGTHLICSRNQNQPAWRRQQGITWAGILSTTLLMTILLTS